MTRVWTAAGRVAAAAMVLVVVAGACTGYPSYRRAQMAEQRGDWDEAVVRYLELTNEQPGNIGYRSALLRAKSKASQMHFEAGKDYYEAGVPERALIEYQQAVQLDSTNDYAKVELDKVRADITAARAGRKVPPTLQEIKDRNRGARAQPPVLSPRSIEPISLDFPKPVSIFDIYKALGKAFGINVLFDPNLKDQQVSITLKDVQAVDALEFLMRTAGHFYKVVDEHSILVASDTPQNRRTYEDLVIQTFFLSNAEVKDVMTMLRSLVGAKNIAANEQLNAIILRDTADKVKVAESIIVTNDKSRAEVVIDVELLQINTAKLRDLGVSLSSYQITQTLDVGGEDVPIRGSDLEFINSSNWILSLPSIVYTFVKNSTDAQVLANPRLRISEGEKASFTVGDKVPIPVTTFNTQNVGSVGGIVPITSFQYQDVGIKIDIEPRVHHNKEVSLKVKVEASNIAGQVAGSGGQSQPIIGTRSIDTTIRLRDGETNFLAGLIRTDESNSEEGIPGLSDIPILGRLFGRQTTNGTRTDLVLTLTPRIVRLPNITEEDVLPIWVGTEANITFRGGSTRVESEVEGPFDEPAADEDAEALREQMRERIQRLPRGALGGDPASEAEPPPEPPRGIDLVPPAFPTAPPPPPPEEEQEQPPDER